MAKNLKKAAQKAKRSLKRQRARSANRAGTLVAEQHQSPYHIGEWIQCLQCGRAMLEDGKGRCQYPGCDGDLEDLYDWSEVREWRPEFPEVPEKDTVYFVEKRDEEPESRVGQWVWCYHCERAMIADEHEKCQYDDCTGFGWDLWDWSEFRLRYPEYPEVPERDKVYSDYKEGPIDKR